MEGYGIDVNQKKWVGEPSPDPFTDNLQKSDELEKPGKVIIKDDYDEFIENK